MTTRGLAALLCLGLGYASSFSIAEPSNLPIDTALRSIHNPENVDTPSANIATVDDNQWSSNTSSTAQDDAQVLWPMMPQESLAQLAQTFYPNSPILAQRFIQKSMRLSRAIGINIQPEVPFQHAQIIAIPNEKEVRALTYRIKKRDELLTEQEQLQLSYQLRNTSPVKTQTIKANQLATQSKLSDKPIALEMPEFNLPKMTLPTWYAPTLETLSHHFNHAWRNTGEQMHALWQASNKSVLEWQGYVFSKADLLSKKYLSQSLANQNTRKAVFVGGLLLLGLILWWLQRRYLQRKIALLNNIESTLIEPEFTEPTIGEIAITAPNDDATEHRKKFNSALEMPTDTLDGTSNAPAFQDTESLVQQLSVDAQLKEDIVSDIVVPRPKRNR